jgi:hypothetical protein
VYSGGHYVYLLGDSSKKCRDIQIISVIIRNYHTEKLVTGNNHLITDSGQGFFPLFLRRFESSGVI